ncbi:Putative DNA-binding protein [Alloactinosynnema sp. L-07]|uniref:helix-turn-helix domain-containing protein n=1 Tax=Alloactinosynnema sp. L-07 TaxID=1653480 RepID=UPI00065F0B80|nr:helix-turn-helix transcriptional regulator [Alloactinosynnema sp. L-07]CRK61541.1 Putative DNA-binding protein [Alloactinosynnema sp. L-07]
MTRPYDPDLLDSLVRRKLRGYREKAGMTQLQAALAMDWSVSKMIRIEQATVGLTTADLKATLAAYGVTDAAELAKMIAMAKQSRAQPWHAPYAEVIGQPFRRMLAYESAATHIREFDPLFIPGLFQTEDYARATVETVHQDRAKVELAVSARLQRQREVLGDGKPKITTILDEAAIRRVVGGPAAMARQLGHLIDTAADPDVTLLVVPFAKGAHIGMAGPFMLLDLEPEIGIETVLFVENLGRDYVTNDDSQTVSEYWDRFFAIEKLTLSESDSLGLLKLVYDDIARQGRTAGR